MHKEALTEEEQQYVAPTNQEREASKQRISKLYLDGMAKINSQLGSENKNYQNKLKEFENALRNIKSDGSSVTDQELMALQNNLESLPRKHDVEVSTIIPRAQNKLNECYKNALRDAENASTNIELQTVESRFKFEADSAYYMAKMGNPMSESRLLLPKNL
jgi:hypothetical protein